MTYLQILNIIKDTALAQPNVNSVVREFLELNREDAKYSAIVIQDRDGNRDRITEQDYVTYTWHLGYVDRLTYDESNRDDIISTGINIINNIVNTIRNTWFPELEVSIVDRINTFDQRFTAQCAGVYVVLAVNAQVSDCVDSESTDLYDTYDAKITENGVYHFVPSGRPVDEINITVDVEGSGKEEVSLTDTVTMNGTHSYIPEEDTVYKDVELTVDVHPTERLVETYTTNGVKTITGEFNGGEITVDVPNDGWDQKNLTEGTYIITNLDNSASFVVSYAFQNNKNIQTVNLPYATTVGSYAFQDCPSLSQVNLPMCSRIHQYAFSYCRSLSQVNLPMCSHIDYAVFGNCYSLSQISLPVCRHIGMKAFQGCHSLSQVNLPMCSEIDDFTFGYCYSLTQISIPLCEYIGNGAFQDCSSLSQVNLPMCSHIGDREFYNCSSFSIITIGYSGVCGLPYDVFNGTPIEYGTGSIYVPASLVDAYKSAENWEYFSNQIFSIPS